MNLARCILQYWLALVLISYHDSASARSIVIDQSPDIPIENTALLFVEDPEGQLAFTDLQAMPDARFFQAPATIPSFGATPSAYWAKFTLVNNSGQPLRKFLVFGYALIDTIDLYWPQNGSYQNLRAGNQVFSRDRSLTYRSPVFDIVIEPGESIFYLRVRNEGINQFPLRLYTPEVFHEMRYKETYKLSFLFGFLVVMALYNFFVGYTTRNATYFFYVGYIAFSISYYLTTQGHVAAFAPERFAAWASKQGLMFFLTGMNCTAVIFTYQFMNLKSQKRFLTWLIVVPLATALPAMAASFFDNVLAMKIMTRSIALTSACALIVSYYCCYRRYRPAYYFAFAWTIFLCGAIAYAFATNGILPWNSLTTWSLFYGSCFEVVMLSLALGDKVNYQQKKSETQIRALNEGLERKVEEKTREIRSLLDYIPQGVFSIEDQLKISKQYSAQLPDILGIKDIAEQSFPDLILPLFRLSADEKDRLLQALQCILGEDRLNFELNAPNLPLEVPFDHASGKQKILEFTWNVDVNTHGIVKRILVTVRDVTESRFIEQEFERQRNEMQFVKELIDCGADRFAQFASTVTPLLAENERLIQSKDSDLSTIRILFVNAHTIKGAARTLGLAQLSNTVHDAEQFYADIIHRSVPIDWERMTRGIELIKDVFHQYLKVNQETLGRKDLNSIPLERQFLAEHCALMLRVQDKMELIDRNLQTEARRSLNRLFQMVYKSLPLVLEDCFQQSARIAADLGKPAPELRMDVPDIPVAQSVENTLRKVSIHLIRNALDHGIEEPRVRAALGKDPHGVISVAVTQKGPLLELLVRDDGQGLAMEQLKRKGQTLGLLSPSPSLQDVADLIFASGVSTSRSITQISGRGIGMQAIKQFVEDAGGSVSIVIGEKKDELGAYLGFAIKIILPLSEAFPLAPLQKVGS